VFFVIGVEYRTTGEQLKNIKDQIENYLTGSVNAEQKNDGSMEEIAEQGD
jgi:Tfp pilus assembly protein PilZ